MSKSINQFFSLIREGAGDEQARAQAEETFKAIHDALGSTKNVDMKAMKYTVPPGSDKVVPAVSINLEKLTGNKALTNLYLAFALDAPANPLGFKASFSYTKTGKQKVIVVAIEIPWPKNREMTQDMWMTIVKKHAQKAFERAKSSFTHEFIHNMDFSRMDKGADVFKKYSEKQKTDPKFAPGSEGYYNNPAEVNAYIQQGLSKIEDHLQGSKSMADAMKVVGKNANEFYQRVLGVLPEKFKSKMNDSNKKKLKKRVAQMWTDVSKRFQGGKQ